MAERLVINSGPLIAFGRAAALDIAGRLPYEIMCPQEVADELDLGAIEGHVVLRPTWLRVLPLAAPLDPVARASLDRGEAAVIQLAWEQGISLVCIDERKARLVAAAVGLRVTGTLGLLVRAKQLGIIPAVRPHIERMKESGIWFRHHLIRSVLDGVGES